MPSMTATRPAASRATAKPCCTAWSTCGACGHKMVVQYKGGTRYLCNYLRQQHGTPVCQSIPAGPIDAAAVDAFFRALAPAELDAYARAVATRREADAAGPRAPGAQGGRPRLQAAVGARPNHPGGPGQPL